MTAPGGAQRASVADRLLARLRTEAPFPVPEGAACRRAYVGRWQRAAGAWSWFLVGAGQVGSPYSMKQCLAGERLAFTHNNFGDSWEVYPDPEPHLVERVGVTS